MLAPFVPGFVAFAALLMLVPVVCRLPLKPAPIVRLFYAALLIEGLMTVVGMTALDSFYPLHASAAFGLFFMLLWFLYGAISKSISLLIVVQMTKEGRLEADVSEIAAISLSEFDKRMDLLQEMRFVDLRDDGRFSPTEAGRRFAGKILATRAVFRIMTSGIYRPKTD